MLRSMPDMPKSDRMWEEGVQEAVQIILPSDNLHGAPAQSRKADITLNTTAAWLAKGVPLVCASHPRNAKRWSLVSGLLQHVAPHGWEFMSFLVVVDFDLLFPNLVFFVKPPKTTTTPIFCCFGTGDF